MRERSKKISRHKNLALRSTDLHCVYRVLLPRDGRDRGEGCKRRARRGSRPVTLSSQKACAPKYHDYPTRLASLAAPITLRTDTRLYHVLVSFVVLSLESRRNESHGNVSKAEQHVSQRNIRFANGKQGEKG